MPFAISKHARDQIALRGITEDVVNKILENPDQIIQLSDKRIYQSVMSENNKQYLIRIIVNYLKEPN